MEVIIKHVPISTLQWFCLLHTESSPVTACSNLIPSALLLRCITQTYWRSWRALGSRGPRYLESNARRVTVNVLPSGQSGAAQRGDRTQGAAELFYQAGKPGLPLRTALGSSSNPRQSSWEAAAGLYRRLCSSCQYVRGGKAVRFFSKERSTSTTLPPFLQGRIGSKNRREERRRLAPHVSIACGTPCCRPLQS